MSYCSYADITDMLLQMLTTFDQHGQYPCKEGRKSSEEKSKTFGLGAQGREIHGPKVSLLDKEGIPCFVWDHSGV